MRIKCNDGNTFEMEGNKDYSRFDSITMIINLEMRGQPVVKQLK